MNRMLNRILVPKLKKKLFKLLEDSPNIPFRKISYSQSGEDLIVHHIFSSLKIDHPSYIDVGAHHPFYLNNTALFYEAGSTGINIEPDPVLFQEFITHRQKDINLNIGVSDFDEEKDFYILSTPTLSTFSREDALKYKNEGDYFIKEVRKVKVVNFNKILTNYCNNVFPEFLTIDAEGVDDLILNSIDFNISYPIVICIETISFSNSGNGVKNLNIINFLISKGYYYYADTNINSIFVRKDKWER
jgi:FkbM family methyltransferase